MDIDEATYVENDCKKEIIAKIDRISKEISVLEEHKRKISALGECLKAKCEETRDVEKEILQLANQCRSFPVEPGGLGNVDVPTRNTDPLSENQLLSDFKGLSIKEEKMSSKYEQFVVELMEKYDEQLHSKQAELEIIHKQMAGEAEKRLEDVPRGYGPDRTHKSSMEQFQLVTAGGEDISLSPSAKLRQLEHVNGLMTKRIDELIENNNGIKDQVNMLKKQKEELLMVNHQWDDQYRQLKADKDRLASQLRQRSGKMREIDETQRQAPDDATIAEMTKVIEQLTRKNAELEQITARLADELDKAKNVDPRSRQPDEDSARIIHEVTMENDKLVKKVNELVEEQKKRDKIWAAAKKMISEEKAAKEAALQMKAAAEEHIKHLQGLFEIEKQNQAELRQEIERLTSAGASLQQPVASSSLVSMNGGNAEQIEMLKQQVAVYADDFANERSDRERIQADREAQKERLKEFEREIKLLKEQIQIYRDDFDNERRDKERLQRQLRERRPDVQVPAEEPWYRVPPADYITMHPRRQPAYPQDNRAYRYSPREIQEIAYQQQQQPLHARVQAGNGHPGGLCHGCEVDCDGPAATLKCPRCERVFASHERRPFEEHIDKCTT
ncbi:TNFAIP3-interacting protein 2-like [Dendronephthya gigantea]|uniref:TNFAIP3-interacting protein 2-like n=1 Tax=Dendronephthya gigantea TaxID=151771 RepID=UPI00106BA39E|nr:TNFAIP3-interacting protein 2-like [Dendronephthya gigantea]XP_028404875.1 TNFAIP3-interacting protein 2-like [Dendronephthya gigantea]XP_028404876.1 TNFAIP3-interacting protein 2-like [Dendronephthya gigantea]XP_028404877.1 TNFAIP3-interacting protein 2-like [Dendronephthya gigantea]XP_028404878.1 TNFAIP3-interacting protein 2-like [Dendronephthya gigantea]